MSMAMNKRIIDIFTSGCLTLLHSRWDDLSSLRENVTIAQEFANEE
jgi:hypothetical protein